MKQVINESLIKRNKKIGTITSILGIAILVAGLIISLKPDPTRTLISFGALILGFIVSQISTYFVSKFGRSPRFDEILENNLNKLNNDYTFYVYSSPIPLLITGPHAIWIPIPIAAGGEIYYQDKWKQRGGNFLLKVFGQENLGNPEKEIIAREREVKSFLEKSLDQASIPPIKSILVSIHPKAVIGDVEGAPTPIVPADSLRRTIRKFDRKSEFDIKQETLETIDRLLRE